MTHSRKLASSRWHSGSKVRFLCDVQSEAGSVTREPLSFFGTNARLKEEHKKKSKKRGEKNEKQMIRYPNKTNAEVNKKKSKRIGQATNWRKKKSKKEEKKKRKKQIGKREETGTKQAEKRFAKNHTSESCICLSNSFAYCFFCSDEGRSRRNSCKVERAERASSILRVGIRAENGIPKPRVKGGEWREDNSAARFAWREREQWVEKTREEWSQKRMRVPKSDAVKGSIKWKRVY